MSRPTLGLVASACLASLMRVDNGTRRIRLTQGAAYDALADAGASAGALEDVSANTSVAACS